MNEDNSLEHIPGDLSNGSEYGVHVSPSAGKLLCIKEASTAAGGISRFAGGGISLPVDPFFSFGPNAFSRSFSSFSMAFFLFSSLEVLASAGLATRNAAKMADDMNDRVSLRVTWFLSLVRPWALVDCVQQRENNTEISNFSTRFNC